LGVDLRSVFIAFKPLWIKAMKDLKRLSVSGQIRNAGLCEVESGPAAPT
jgi:hypothetical protein